MNNVTTREKKTSPRTCPWNWQVHGSWSVHGTRKNISVPAEVKWTWSKNGTLKRRSNLNTFPAVYVIFIHGSDVLDGSVGYFEQLLTVFEIQSKRKSNCAKRGFKRLRNKTPLPCSQNVDSLFLPNHFRLFWCRPSTLSYTYILIPAFFFHLIL